MGLPPDLARSIASYLPVRDIAALAAVSRGARELARARAVWCGLLWRDFGAGAVSAGGSARGLGVLAWGRDAREAYRTRDAERRAAFVLLAEREAARAARAARRWRDDMIAAHWILEFVPSRWWAGRDAARAAAAACLVVALLCCGGVLGAPALRHAVHWWLGIIAVPLLRIIGVPMFYAWAAQFMRRGAARRVARAACVGAAAVAYLAAWRWLCSTSVFEVVMADYLVRRSAMQMLRLAAGTLWPAAWLWRLCARVRDGDFNWGPRPRALLVGAIASHVLVAFGLPATLEAAVAYSPLVRGLIHAHETSLVVLLAWLVRCLEYGAFCYVTILRVAASVSNWWYQWRRGWAPDVPGDVPTWFHVLGVIAVAVYFERAMGHMFGNQFYIASTEAAKAYRRQRVNEFIMVVGVLVGAIGAPIAVGFAMHMPPGQKRFPVAWVLGLVAAALAFYRGFAWVVRAAVLVCICVVHWCMCVCVCVCVCVYVCVLLHG